jgi:hypothetical protein
MSISRCRNCPAAFNTRGINFSTTAMKLVCACFSGGGTKRPNHCMGSLGGCASEAFFDSASLDPSSQSLWASSLPEVFMTEILAISFILEASMCLDEI